MKRFVFSTALFTLALGAFACGGDEADLEVSEEAAVPKLVLRPKLEPICVTATLWTRSISCPARTTSSGDAMPQVRNCYQECTTCGSSTTCGAERCETECHDI